MGIRVHLAKKQGRVRLTSYAGGLEWWSFSRLWTVQTNSHSCWTSQPTEAELPEAPGRA